MINEPKINAHHLRTDPGRKAQDRAAHLRYMRERQHSRSRMSLSSQYDVPRTMLRDGSALMYPERAMGENWKPGAVEAEVAAALERRAKPQPVPAPAPVPRGKHERVRHYKLGPLPRKFEQRRTA
jgi:hypothetical protein